MKTGQIKDQINKLSLDECKEMNSFVVHRIKQLRKVKAKGLKRELNVGDVVTLNGEYPPFNGEFGRWEVEEIKRTRFVGKETATGQRCNIPISMVYDFVEA